MEPDQQFAAEEDVERDGDAVEPERVSPKLSSGKRTVLLLKIFEHGHL